jgi:hypothetical protein
LEHAIYHRNSCSFFNSKFWTSVWLHTDTEPPICLHVNNRTWRQSNPTKNMKGIFLTDGKSIRIKIEERNKGWDIRHLNHE